MNINTLMTLLKTHYLGPRGQNIRQFAFATGIPRGRLAKLMDGRGTPRQDEVESITRTINAIELKRKKEKEVSKDSNIR